MRFRLSAAMTNQQGKARRTAVMVGVALAEELLSGRSLAAVQGAQHRCLDRCGGGYRWCGINRNRDITTACGNAARFTLLAARTHQTKVAVAFLALRSIFLRVRPAHATAPPSIWPRQFISSEPRSRVTLRLLCVIQLRSPTMPRRRCSLS